MPLYTREDAELALQNQVAVDFKLEVSVGEDVKFRLYPAGQIPGAASVELSDLHTSIIFSGDLGRPDDPIKKPPTPLDGADYLVVESTLSSKLLVSAHLRLSTLILDCWKDAVHQRFFSTNTVLS